jgi:hypothetical protein
LACGFYKENNVLNLLKKVEKKQARLTKAKDATSEKSKNKEEKVSKEKVKAKSK